MSLVYSKCHYSIIRKNLNLLFNAFLLTRGTIIVNKVYTKEANLADIFTAPSSTMIMRLLF